MMRRALKVYLATFLLVLYAPSLLLPVFAFNDSAIIAFPLSGFTPRWFGVLWQTDALHHAALNSLMIAASSAVLATALGLCVARAWARHSFYGKTPILGFIMLPMLLPEIIVGVSLLIVIVQAGLELSLWTIVLGHVLICTPFSAMVLRSSFQQLDPYMEEASYDLGQSRLATLCFVTLPLIMPGIISSLLITFTISLDEFVIAFFLSGTEPTLPVYIWSQLRFPQKIPSVMALGTLLLILSVVLLILSEIIRRRGSKWQ
ncbi:MAG: ABC transporter permease [Paracoccaceae bacterium]